MKTLLAVISLVVAVLALDYANKQGSNRVVMEGRIELNGVEVHKRYRCVSSPILLDLKEGCFDADNGQYLGQYWDLHPKLARIAEDTLGWAFK